MGRRLQRKTALPILPHPSFLIFRFMSQVFAGMMMTGLKSGLLLATSIVAPDSTNVLPELFTSTISSDGNWHLKGFQKYSAGPTMEPPATSSR